MGQHLLSRSAVLAALAAAALGCAGPAALPAPPHDARTGHGPAVDTCYNLAYGFTCVPPPGFIITSEGPGPGEIMALVKRSRTTSEEANLTLSVHRLRGDRLKWLVKERVYSPLKSAPGLKRIEMKEGRLGGREGFEVRAEREYATGLFYSRSFCFEQGGDAYIVELTAPASRAEDAMAALDAFVNSIAFR